MPLQQFDEHTPFQAFLRLTDTDTTVWTGFLIGDGIGERFDQMIMSSDDSAPRVIEFEIDDGGSPVYLGGVPLPAGAGQGAVPAVDVLAALQTGGLGAIILMPGIAMQWRSTSTITTGKFATIQVVGGKF